MEAKGKLTKEVVAQEARFILDHLLNASKYSPEVQLEELRRLCEQSVSLRLTDYVAFLERFGYLTYDRATHMMSITSDGERVVAGEKMAELVIDVVHHFRPILSRTRTGVQEAVQAQPSNAGQPGHQIAQPKKQAAGRERIDDRYEKVKMIGSGGIGTVYLARQAMLDRDVALKEVRELFGFFTEPQRQEIARRFNEEVRNAARLSHPNVASILDGNTGREYPYVVSEFVSGGSLRRVLKYADQIPPELSVKVVLQLLHGLGHAHNLGVIHRGLKPENILFDSAGNVRITDFGMSRVVERDQAVIKHVYVGMGSVAYMAPELFSDSSSAGVQTDLYAIGILLYEMLARKLPGRRSPMPTKLHPKLPPIIDDMFDRLTQDERDDRYKSVDEVLEEFYSSDAARDFMEPRGAMLFRDSPLDKLDIQVEEEEEEEEEPPPEAVAEQPAPPPTQDHAPAATMPSPTTMPADPQPAEAAPADDLVVEEINVGEAGGHSEHQPEPALDAISSEVSSSQSEVEGEEQQTDQKRRRSRAHRPYSFQQRMKERDKQ